MSQPWFGPKANGIGLTPTTFAGWAVTLLFILSLVAEGRTGRALHSPPLMIGVLIVITVALYLAVVAWKSDKAVWKWRWNGR